MKFLRSKKPESVRTLTQTFELSEGNKYNETRKQNKMNLQHSLNPYEKNKFEFEGGEVIESANTDFQI